MVFVFKRFWIMTWFPCWLRSHKLVFFLASLKKNINKKIKILLSTAIYFLFLSSTCKILISTGETHSSSGVSTQIPPVLAVKVIIIGRSSMSFPQQDQRPEVVFTKHGRKICVKSDFTYFYQKVFYLLGAQVGYITSIE